MHNKRQHKFLQKGKIDKGRKNRKKKGGYCGKKESNKRKKEEKIDSFSITRGRPKLLTLFGWSSGYNGFVRISRIVSFSKSVVKKVQVSREVQISSLTSSDGMVYF